jgi:hypothetical protein
MWNSNSISSPSCRGGEGSGGSGAMVFSIWRRPLQWWYYFDELNQGRGIIASAIFGGHAALLQPPCRRLFSIFYVGARRFFVTTWCVPGGLKESSGGGSSPEGGNQAMCP